MMRESLFQADSAHDCKLSPTADRAKKAVAELERIVMKFTHPQTKRHQVMSVNAVCLTNPLMDSSTTL
jgi:hypothetical protein